jgi:peptide/nickel transport system permease protein
VSGEQSGLKLCESSQLTAWWKAWREANSYRRAELARSVFAFRRSTLSLVGLAILICVVLVAIFAPLIAPYPEDATGATHTGIRLQPPSRAHLFGTDDLGRDILSRVVLSTGLALKLVGIVSFIAIFVGITLGAWAGFAGGLVDELIMRTSDLFMTMPSLLMALVVMTALGPGIGNAMVALSVVWWPGYCRLMRGQVLVIREEQYVEAARAMGGSRMWIIRNHIVPNCLPVIIVRASMNMGYVLMAAAGLGFLGLGAVPPQPEWGAMVSEARRYFPESWWFSVFPGAAIFLTALGLTLIGDGLRDLREPTARR